MKKLQHSLSGYHVAFRLASQETLGFACSFITGAISPPGGSSDVSLQAARSLSPDRRGLPHILLVDSKLPADRPSRAALNGAVPDQTGLGHLRQHLRLNIPLVSPGVGLAVRRGEVVCIVVEQVAGLLGLSHAIDRHMIAELEGCNNSQHASRRSLPVLRKALPLERKDVFPLPERVACPEVVHGVVGKVQEALVVHCQADILPGFLDQLLEDWCRLSHLRRLDSGHKHCRVVVKVQLLNLP
mmetsp:Transcript_2647/g.7491  ORF Transcript_2647/g.7491 Transcript_2647/m.7491 type:complete len:242 (-) Transcript_2647:1098-1823(-)